MTLINKQAKDRLQDIIDRYEKLGQQGFRMDFTTSEAIKLGILALEYSERVWLEQWKKVKGSDEE